MTLNITPDSASGVPVKAVGPPTIRGLMYVGSL